MERYVRTLLFGVFVMCGYVSLAFAGYTGPDLKLPMQPGSSILCTVETGGQTMFPPPDDFDSYHAGNGFYSIDFDDRYGGDPVVAAAGGVATIIDSTVGYGKHVIINHGGGYTTIYAHLASFSINNENTVQQGQQLGVIGSTGNSTGTHLHFAIKYNGGGASSIPELSDVELDNIPFLDYEAGDNYQSTNYEVGCTLADLSTCIPPITDRGDLTFQALNPYSGIDNEDTLLHKMGGAINEPHWWFDTAVTYTNGGVARNTVLRDYSGGDKVGVILVHPDSHYAVQLYDKYWYTWAAIGQSVDTVNDCNTEWFSQGRGPLSNFGLPITGVYRVGSGLWRQDFQVSLFFE